MEKFKKEWKNNKDYFELLQLMGSLSNLYSSNDIPFIHYRMTENIFCKCFNAKNLSRSDTAYDAKKDSIGVGIKTFQLKNSSSVEKVAEFNSISSKLKNFKGKDLAIKLAEARNDRIDSGKNVYGINDGLYHIVGRDKNKLIIFNTDYPYLSLNKIEIIKDDKTSLQFRDDNGEYFYNHSKSTLFKRFEISKDKIEIPVEIIDDPYEILKQLITKNKAPKNIKDLEDLKFTLEYSKNINLKLGVNFVVLPLFSPRAKIVPLKSGLNQWNAGGRTRDPNEVYIPIPIEIHRNYPKFFPKRDKPFNLYLPDGEIISAKVCQDNSKALMSNPNKKLGEWMLRKVMRLPEGRLVTIDLLNQLGFDSVLIKKRIDGNYELDVCWERSYSDIF